MKANELRIGNLLDYYGTTCFVLELLINDYAEFGYFTDSVGFNRKLTEKHSPKPIPLTEQWLFKLGAVKEVYEDDEDDYYLIIRGDEFDIIYENDEVIYLDIVGKIVDLKHVHQLQNLYFALTGEELTLNK